MSSIEQLTQLYAKMSKHSNYQVLSPKLQEMTGGASFNTCSRWERERFEYILATVPVHGKTVLDIGGNSGYFTFEALEAGATRALYFEGNTAHSDFVTLATQLLDVADRVVVQNRYYGFDGEQHERVHLGLLLNVLHHVGDDYGDKYLGLKAAKKLMAEQLNSMADKVGYLALQIGFCWKGDTNYLLFPNGTKCELIDFVSDAVDGAWDILNIGIPEKVGEVVSYCSPNEENMRRDDALGEFLNRPLFILKSHA